MLRNIRDICPPDPEDIDYDGEADGVCETYSVPIERRACDVGRAVERRHPRHVRVAHGGAEVDATLYEAEPGVYLIWSAHWHPSAIPLAPEEVEAWAERIHNA